MGLLNMLRSGKQAEEITRAFIAGYVFSSLLDDNQRDSIMIHIYRMLSESGPFKMSFDEAQDKFNSSPAIVQAAFMANAMIDLGIQHGIKGFDWEYIPTHLPLNYIQKERFGMLCQK